MAQFQYDEDGNSIERANQLQEDLQLKLKEEDAKWRQRKFHWLKHGDNNTKFFHLHGTQRRKTNKITHMQDRGALIYD